MFSIVRPTTEEQLAAYYDLRWRVLREPWNQPRGSERDELDEMAHHRMASDPDGRIIGVGRMHLNDAAEAQIRYMAVAADNRGQGVGRALVNHLESIARELGAKTLVLNSRDEVVGFYKRLGFSVIGVGPTMFGEVSHSRMEKETQR